MKYVIEEENQRRYYNHLGYWQRVKLFFKTKKRRFFYIFLFVLTFNYSGNISGFITSKLERTAKKYKKRWILKYNPHIFTYQSAIESDYTPSKLSQPSTERLCEAFLKYDRQLRNGFSRQLIVNILMKVKEVEQHCQMGKMNEKESLTFFADSGYMTMRKRVLCSLYMKEFLQLIESKIQIDPQTGSSDELQFFEKRMQKQIEEFEKKNLGPHGKEADKQSANEQQKSDQTVIQDKPVPS